MRKSALSALMFMIALAALAPVGAQAAAGWSAPVKIDGAGQLESVSCVSGGFCAATDFDGNALTEQGGDWTAPKNVDSGNTLFSVSCTSASFCAAVDDADANASFPPDHAVVWNGSTWSSTSIPGQKGPISCVAASGSPFCIAVGVGNYPGGNQPTSDNESQYSDGSWSTTTIDGGEVLDAVSCVAQPTVWCAALDAGGSVLYYSQGSWSASESIDPGVGFQSVSCTSTSFCVAVDQGGGTLTFNGSSWSSPSIVGGGLYYVTCTSSSFCMASPQVGASSDAYVYNGSSWSATGPLPGGGEVGETGLSCVGTVCDAVLGSGYSIYPSSGGGGSGGGGSGGGGSGGGGSHVALITKAKISHHTAKFTFKSSGAVTGFQCALVMKPKKDHKTPEAHFSGCTSPKTYEHLKAGKYMFEVRAVTAARPGTPATKAFTIG